MKHPTAELNPERPRPAVDQPILWASLVSGPATWSVHLLAGYGLVGVSCELGTSLPIYIITIIALGIVAAGGYGAYSQWKRLATYRSDGANRTWERDEMLLVSAMVMNGLFAAIIAGSGIQTIFWSTCGD